jgi:hypothetical protein
VVFSVADGQQGLIEMGYLEERPAATERPFLAEERRLLSSVAALLASYLECKRAEAALRFLAEASTVLATSLDYETTLQRVARLTVPTLADCCFFDVRCADGRLRRVVGYHGDPGQQAVFARLLGYTPPVADPEHPVARVLATGRSEVVTEVDEGWLAQAAISPAHLQLLRALQFRSLMTVRSR